MIAEKWDGSRAFILQKDIISLIIENSHLGSIGRQDIFSNGWLNIEGLYRAEGWSVTYDRPGYNETYEASFTFKKKK